MLLYLLFLVGIIIIYRFYKEGEGFSNPFGELDSICLYHSNNTGPIKTTVNGESFYTNGKDDFVNYDYNSILIKADINTYFSSNKPRYCRI